MDYEALKRYLTKQMSMAHIYQPVMIKAILKSSKPVTAEAIAKNILEHDLSQIEYYEKVTKQMPAKYLKKHGVVKQQSDGYVLDLGNAALTKQQKKTLMALCDAKVAEYKAKRGMGIWEHRRRGRTPVPRSDGFKVLSRAGFHCQLCGISADERHLEVDHIIPKNLGGADTLDNYQALCYRCNSSKRDTDKTDFREWQVLHKHREPGCFFCKPDKGRILAESELAYILKDGFPVTEGHALIIPKRHVASLFDLFDPEVKACMRLIKEHKVKIEKADKSVEGFNVGVNVNEAGGQTIFHCHWHLIPRRKGDVPNPRGGVRHIIPGKGSY
jgi:diadenosine tetraphosphate (Ap4A) HIT family hydrolase